MMSAGGGQGIVGGAFSTLSAAARGAGRELAASVGVNATESVCAAPALSTVPATGEYTNVPGTLAVAFSCVALSAVPNVMSAGAAHVIVGVAFSTLMATVRVAVV